MKATNLTRQQSLAISRGLVAPTAARSFSWIEDMTNGEGADILEGSVVVVVSNGTVELADTLNDPRPVGVALDTIDDGETGQVAFGGPVDKVLTTGSVTAGDFGQTSTTAGQAQVAPSGPTAFLEFTDSGTDPSAFLWGGRGGGGFGGGSGSGTPAWFDVTAFGATGDGTTDDTTAINSAIAALVAAGCGVLYFPCGTYKVTAALTTLSVPCLVLGDGKGRVGTGVSVITTAHATAVLFTVSVPFVEFRGLGLVNTATTPTAGAAIATATGGGTVCRYQDLWVEGFYDCLSLQYGGRWVMDGCQIVDFTRYGIHVANIDSPDGGDWSLSNVEITTSSVATHTPTAAIRQDSAGGGKVVNLKVNSDAAHPIGTGYDLNINGAANNTSILTIASSSIENVSGDAIKLTTVGTGLFALVSISNLQVGLYGNNSGRVVNAAAASAGSYATAGTLGIIAIDGIVAFTDGTARAAVSLTNTDRVTLGDMSLQGFNARYTSSGDTNTIDGTAISYATPAIVFGTAAASGAASTVIRSDSTIVAFDATVPVTQAFGDSAAAGSAAVAARRDHVHGMPAEPTTAGAHAHVASETHLSNGSTTTWTLDQVFEPGSVIAWNTTTLARLGVTEMPPDQVTVSAAGTSGDSIVFDYAASIA